MLSIVSIPLPGLRERSVEVAPDWLTQPANQTYIDELIRTMYDDDGIGIAACQVGDNIRLFVVGKDAIPPKHELAGQDLIIVNPQVVITSKKMLTETEGCLSVPGSYGQVKRYKNVSVSGLDRHVKPIKFDASAFFARVIQHEFDHLNGTLYIDRATSLEPAEHPRRLDFDLIQNEVRPPS